MKIRRPGISFVPAGIEDSGIVKEYVIHEIAGFCPAISDSGQYMDIFGSLSGLIGDFTAMSPTKIISEILGTTAVIISLFSYQMRTRKGILFSQTAASGFFCIHFLLLGAVTLSFQNVILVIRNLSYANRDKIPFSSRYLPAVFSVLLVGCGFLTWEGPRSLFVSAGLVANTVGLTFSDAQKIRKSILVSSPLVMIYSILSASIAGVANEVIAISSSVVGIIRYRGTKDTSGT